MVELVSQRWAQHRAVEQIVDVLVRQTRQKIIEVMKGLDVSVPKVVEKSVDVPGSQIRKENGEVTQRIPQVRVSDHIVEQSTDVSVAQNLGTNCRSGESQPSECV